MLANVSHYYKWENIRLRNFIGAGICLFLAGCSSSAKDIRPVYVSPLEYQRYSCRQIGGEAARISRRVAEVSGVQDDKASGDAVATGVALVLFWPAAFMIKGDGQAAAELGRLKGEFETLEKVSIQKNCRHKFQRARKKPRKNYKHNWQS